MHFNVDLLMMLEDVKKWNAKLVILNLTNKKYK